MTDLSARALKLAARWRGTLRDRSGDDSSLASVLSWIRTIALESDVLYLDTLRWPEAPLGGAWLGRRRGYFRFRMPCLPSARPEPITEPDARSRVRFVVRARPYLAPRPSRRGPEAVDDLPTSGCEPGWRSILNLRDLIVIERDAPHAGERPLRLGLCAEEAARVLAQARMSAERFIAGAGQDVLALRSMGDPPRLAQRSTVAVALWTRGRLRGSVISSPGPALRTVGQAAISACQDARFPRLSTSDLTETVFQVGLLHAPRVPLSRHEIETCKAYPDKALFVSDGTRSGAYMPEAFNVFPHRMVRLQAITESLARDKAGLSSLGPSARVEVNEVTEVIESADRSRALRLDGPVARWEGMAAREHARVAGQAACGWLAAIQADDGSLPLFVRPSTGEGDNTDVVRCAMTAEALAAFGVACGLESAVDSARRVLAWLDRSRQRWVQNRAVALPTAIYRGKAAGWLGDDTELEVAARSVLERLDSPDPGPLVLANAASFLDRASARHAPAAHKGESLRRELAERFTRATAGETPVSLAEWAELAAAFPADSKTSREVRDWLRSWQLPSGAFPETTTSDFVYSRGTGKVFEVLALRPAESPDALDRSLAWLLSMQYRPDSAFFVPHEYWGRVLGGLRHDYHGPDAWIDAAGHFLLGLARLLGR
jgi:AMMECR1 domain-containing protein